MRFILAVLALWSSSAFAGSYFFAPKSLQAPQVASSSKVHDAYESVVLTEKNTIYLSGEVGSGSVSKAIEDLANIKSNEVYLYIKSPGGSVFDGIKLASAIMGSDKKISCIADFAASMATVLFEICDERLVVRNTVLMQHVATFGIQAQPEPNAKSFFDFIRQITVEIETAQAKRVGVSKEEFDRRVRNDWWLFGLQAVESKMADRMVEVSCSKSLIENTFTQNFMTFFGPVIVEWSTCPVLDEPKKVDFMGSLVEDKQKIEFIQDLNVRAAHLKAHGMK